MFNFLTKHFDPNKKAIQNVDPIVDQIFELEDSVTKMTAEKMRERVNEMRSELKLLTDKLTPEEQDNIKKPKEKSEQEIAIYNKVQDFLPEIFAFLREINNRKFHKKHFRVQLIASVILAQGNKLTELKTGEGKTQVFHLPAALYGLTRRGSHLVTVNDYLARRDGEYAGHAMADLGITVGIITPQASYKFVSDQDLLKVKGEEAVTEREKLNIASMTDMHGVNLIECTKQEAYLQDVLYGTNNELGFDYLRDNMVYNQEDRAQRELYYCIVDEADSILIDEARTPLIISAPAEESNELYQRFALIVKKLTIEKHYVVDEKAHAATLTEEGISYVEQLLNVKNIWEDYQLAHHLDNALKAETLFKNNEEYLVKNNEVLIVDEFTGRILPGRRYSEGLHQAIEAKEGVEIKKESKTLATITFQNYFRIYKILSGGSGTIMTEAEEFAQIYHTDSYQIPTNKPLVRDDRSDKIYKNKSAKFNAVAEEIIEINKTGQPVLVGTTTIEDSEFLSGILDRKGIEHEVLNAKFHEREAAIVAKAGQKNALTVATNMAGRGTDIPLGDGVQDLGGLFILGTQRHEARRIDNQLRGRSGRQGDPGVSQFFVALDDEIMRIQGGELVQKFMEITKIPDDIPIQSGMISKAIENAQKKMEGYHFDIRKRVVDYDDVINQQREIFYARRLNIVRLPESKDALTKVQEILKNIFTAEVDNIIKPYLVVDEITPEDKQHILNDFKDLADDTLIIDTFRSLDKGNDLNTYLQSLDLEGISELFENIIQKIALQKFQDFSVNLAELYKITALQIMDELWTDHLDVMTDLREGIGLRGYAQLDPLVEYKNEAYTKFEKFISTINSQIAKRILKIKRVMQAPQIQRINTNADQVSDVLTGSREILAGPQASNEQPVIRKPKPVINSSKIKRNDLCPCGSGLKYKKCGLINAPQHRE